jgi:hypothetical protein
MNGGRRINVRGQVKKASQDDHDLPISSFEDFFLTGLINADPETKSKAAASTKADRLRRDAYILVMFFCICGPYLD